MPTVDEFWAVAAQVAGERGGLVVGVTGEEQPELGSTLYNVLGFQSRGPVTVIGPAEWDDWKRQGEVFYRLRPGWGRGHPGDPSARYYRIKLDEQEAMRANPALGAVLSSGSSSSTLGQSGPSFGGYMEVRSGLRGATFPPRAAARLIDLILQYALGFAAGRLFFFMIFFSSGGHPPMWGSAAAVARPRVHISGLISGALLLSGDLDHNLRKLVRQAPVFSPSVAGRWVSLPSAIRCDPRVGVLRGRTLLWADRVLSHAQNCGAATYGDEWANTIVCQMSHVPASSRQTGMQFALAQTIGIAACFACMLLGLLLQML